MSRYLPGVSDETKNRLDKERGSNFQSSIANPSQTGFTPIYNKDGGAMKNIKMYQDASNIAEFEFALDESAREFETAYQAQQLQREQARAQFIQAMQARDIQMNAQLGAYEKNQELIANQLLFNQAGAERALDDSRTVLGNRLKGIESQASELGFQQEESAINVGSQLAELDVADFQSQQDYELAVSQARRRESLTNASIQLQKDVDDSRANFALKQRQDEAAFNTQRIQLERAQALGRARSLGRKGSTAKQSYQTISAISGINISQIEQQLLGYETQAQAESGFRDRQLTISTDESRFARQAAERGAAANRDISKARTAITRDRVLTLETVANNRFALSAEDLGESMISALQGFEQQKQQIFLDKFKADAQAYAARMTEPQFADAPKEPFKIPDVKFIPPPMPIEVPKGQVQKQPQQKTSTLGKILQIGGLALAAAAIPVSAGTLTIGLGASGALQGVAGGAVLAGLGGVATNAGSSGWF